MNETPHLTATDVEERVRQFITQNFLFGAEDERLTRKASFLESGIIDSTGILELINFIEEAYGFSVEDAEMLPANLDSIRDVSAFVARKRRS